MYAINQFKQIKAGSDDTALIPWAFVVSNEELTVPRLRDRGYALFRARDTPRQIQDADCGDGACFDHRSRDCR